MKDSLIMYNMDALKLHSLPLCMLHSSLLHCTPPTPIDTISLLFFSKKFEKWRCFLRAHSFERSAQDRDRTLVSDPQCSVLHNRRLRRVSAAVAFRRRNTRKERSRLNEETRCTASRSNTSTFLHFELALQKERKKKPVGWIERRDFSLSLSLSFHPEEKMQSDDVFLLSWCRRGSVVAGSTTSLRHACKFGRKKIWKERTDVRALTYSGPWQQTDQ